MNKDVKKEKERGAGMILLGKFGLNPDSSVVDFNRESPDYTFRVNGRVIGVEITYCLPSAYLSNGEINFEKAYNLVNLILADCEESVNKVKLYGGYEISITLFDNVINMLSIRHPKTCKIREATLKEFADLIPRLVGVALNRSVSLNLDGDMISRITVFRCKNLKGIKVLRGAFGGFAKKLNPEMIAYCLHSKEQKLNMYMNSNDSIDEYWLQIHIPYSEIYDASSLDRLKVSSKYNQVYVTDSGGGCYRIKNI